MSVNSVFENIIPKRYVCSNYILSPIAPVFNYSSVEEKSWTTVIKPSPSVTIVVKPRWMVAFVIFRRVVICVTFREQSCFVYNVINLLYNLCPLLGMKQSVAVFL